MISLIYLLIDCRYLVTEGQIFVVYFITFIAMLGYMTYKKTKQNSQLDANGLFLLYSFALCFVLVIIWVMYLWNDEALRLKYPGLLYIPEPWSYYTLYIRKWYWTIAIKKVKAHDSIPKIFCFFLSTCIWNTRRVL